MSNTELLLKEIEGLPADYMGEILNFVGYLKHKAPQDSTDNTSSRMSAREALTMGRGIAKRLGSTLTVDSFLELGRQDRILEDALDAVHRKERMQLREKKQRTV